MRRCAALAAVLVACTAATPKPHVPASAPPAAHAPDTSGWTKDWPKTWTDPRVVDALASSCAFDPKLTPPEDGHFDTPPDMFRCTVGYSQSCTPDLCAGVSCEADCTTTCLDCGGGCTTSCNTCKASCKDDACRHRCAEQCAQCKQGCITTLERCTTADCGKVHADCEKRMQAAWKKNNCASKCKRWLSCAEGCERAKDPEACGQRCGTTASPRFDACQTKCETEAVYAKASACMTECYINEPCSPFACHVFTTAEEIMKQP